MSIELIDKIKPKNGKDFPLVDAEDVLMPDGKRLDELTTAYPVTEGADVLQPDRYYDFGEVSSLAVTLAEVDDGLAHEYCFEFIPKEDFAGLTISPEVSWACEPQYPMGKTCQVSVLRGVAVMICA